MMTFEEVKIKLDRMYGERVQSTHGSPNDTRYVFRVIIDNNFYRIDVKNELIELVEGSIYTSNFYTSYLEKKIFKNSYDHFLKTQQPFFELIIGLKTCECRINDRDFRPGQYVCLVEIDDKKIETGRTIEAQITHVLTGEKWGIMTGFCVLSFKLSA